MSGFTPVVRVKSPGQAALELVQSEFRDYHPLIALARMAHQDNVKQDPKLELMVHQSILPYVAPKLAVKEVEPLQADDRRIVVSLFEDVPTEKGISAPAEVPLLIDEASELIPIHRVS